MDGMRNTLRGGGGILGGREGGKEGGREGRREGGREERREEGREERREKGRKERRVGRIVKQCSTGVHIAYMKFCRYHNAFVQYTYIM